MLRISFQNIPEPQELEAKKLKKQLCLFVQDLHTTYIKKVEKMHKEQADLEAAMFDNTNQLRWIRRRASTAASAARNLIDVLQAHVKATSTAEVPPGPNTSAPNKFSFSVTDPDEDTVACLESCLKVFDEDPESDWGSLRSTIKHLTKNPLDCNYFPLSSSL